MRIAVAHRRAISSTTTAIIAVVTLLIGIVAGSLLAPMLVGQRSVTSTETIVQSVTTTVSTSFVRVIVQPTIPTSPCCNNTNFSGTTLTTYITADMQVSGDISIACAGCGGGELNNSQFQGLFSFGQRSSSQQIQHIAGNFSGSNRFDSGFFGGPGVFQIGWVVWKNTINGSLEVNVTLGGLGNFGTIFDRSTSEPYGSLSGSWSAAPCDPTSPYCQ